MELKAERQQIAKVCPKPATPQELRTAADDLQRHPDIYKTMTVFDRLDQGARICRGS